MEEMAANGKARTGREYFAALNAFQELERSRQTIRSEGARDHYRWASPLTVFGLAPFQGAWSLARRFPGLKPRAEAYSPFVALNLPNIPNLRAIRH
jgi:hypothetical protein